MAQRVILLLTEGDHDAAFIYRILRANGFNKFSRVIKDFPTPLNKILASDILNISIPDESLQNARTRFLPSNVVSLNNNLLLIYAMQGDSRADKRIKLIEAFKLLVTRSNDEIQVSPDMSIAALYFLDADDVGVSARLNEINSELQTIFPDAEIQPFVSNGTSQSIENIIAGAYIFAEQESDKGKLEDVLLPIMEDGNVDIFAEARKFLSIHENTTLFRDNVTYEQDATTIKKVFSDKYYPKKSLIGTIGQLQKSGKSNTVCISDSNYLTNDKLTANPTCNLIVEFINQVMI